MKKILFPTEFSAHAPEVLKYAADLAYFFKAKLTLLYVLPKLELNSDSEINEVLDELSNQMLQFIESHLPEGYKNIIDLKFSARIGEPGKAITEFALNEEIDLIVMGTKGKSNNFKTILGSVSHQVLQQATCPVLLIPKSSVFRGFDQLVYTTNFEFRDLGGLDFMLKWAKVYEAKIDCLHIVEDHANKHHAVQNMQMLNSVFHKQKAISFCLANGPFHQSIEDFAMRKQADALAMMMHKKNFLSRLLDKKNMVEEIALNTNVPLLIIKGNVNKNTGDSKSENWLKTINSDV